MLVKAPILHLPDFTKEFVVITDRSMMVIGYLLVQKDINGHHTFAFMGVIK